MEEESIKTNASNISASKQKSSNLHKKYDRNAKLQRDFIGRGLEEKQCVSASFTDGILWSNNAKEIRSTEEKNLPVNS